jgi:hypothetical protein
MAVPAIHHDKLLYTTESWLPSDNASQSASSNANVANPMMVPENTLPQRTS